MNRIWYVVGAVALVAVIGLTSAPFLVPASLYKAQIQQAATDALGRDVTLEGEMKLSLFPRIEARTGVTRIANPDGFGDAPFAQMTELRTAVKLLPLLARRVEIDEFVLVDPEINLVRLESGEANWVFSSGEPTAPTDTEETGGSGGGDFSAVLGDVRLVNGAISYEDRQSGVSHSVESLDITLKMDALDKPLTLDGDGVLDGLAVDLDARVENAKAIIDGAASAVEINLDTDIVTGGVSGEITGGDAMVFDLAFDVALPSVTETAAFFDVSDLPAAAALGRAELAGRLVGAPGDLSIEGLNFSHASELLLAQFDGTARIAETVSFAGQVDLDAPNLRGLAQSAGAELPEGDIYRRFAFSGAASGGPNAIALTDATLTFDDIVATGAAKLSLTGTPKLVGTLQTTLIDATPYAAPSNGDGAATSGDDGGGGDVGGWGDAPIDLSPLKLIDAELDITADALKFQNWDIGQSVLAVTLQEGRLVADLKRTSLYGGAGVATITADGRYDTPKIGVQAELQGLDIESFLGAAANFDRIEGGGAFEVNLAGEGATMDALMGSLAGAGAFDFADGAVRGVNLAQLVRSAQDALTAGALPTALSEEAATDFTDLTGSFTIANGVASSDNVSLLSPFLTVEGGGSLDIGNRSLDFSLFPEATDETSGINGLGIPVKLSGGWSNIAASLDFDWLTRKATAALTNELGGQVANQLEDAVGEELGGVLGGALGLSSGEEDDDDAETSDEDKIRNALGGLFDN